MQYISLNGQVIPADQAIANARNRGLRYGDGLFETMRVQAGNIILGPLHFERLYHGLKLLQFNLPPHITPGWLAAAVTALCKKNELPAACRVRLNIFRGNGSLFAEEEDPYVVIEAEPLPAGYDGFNPEGLRIGIYPDARKSCDVLANLKSNNYLPYVLAAQYARQQQWNDCLLLNAFNRISDATIANVWWIKSDTIFTPPLSEGCVAGVMRKYLLQHLVTEGFVCREEPVTPAALLEADELFFTNALFGIRWVSILQQKTFSNTITARLYRHFIHPLHTP